MNKVSSIFILFFIFSSYLAVAEEKNNYRSYTNEEIRVVFLSASQIDHEFGVTKEELFKEFGKYDSVQDSIWNGGKQYIYNLTDNRKMRVDILNGKVMLAVIHNPSKSNFLLYK